VALIEIFVKYDPFETLDFSFSKGDVMENAFQLLAGNGAVEPSSALLGDETERLFVKAGEDPVAGLVLEVVEGSAAVPEAEPHATGPGQVYALRGG